MKPAQLGLVLHFLIYQFIYLSRIFNQAGPVQLRAVLNLDLLHLSHSFLFFFQFIFLLFIFRTKQFDRRPSAEKGNNIPFKLVEVWEECSGKVR